MAEPNRIPPDAFEDLRESAERRLRREASRKGVSVETYLAELPTRDCRRAISREEVDAELAKPFRFARF